MQSILLTAASIVGCASSALEGAKKVHFGGNEANDEERRPISQAELQEDLQRFVSQFLERATQSVEHLSKTQDTNLRLTAARHLIRLGSSALEIASGPYPEVSLLDMMTFVRLNRQVVASYWVPKVYGETKESRELLEAFDDAEKDIDKVADKVLSRDQRKVFDGLVDAWRKENPNLVRVEWIRLSDFSRKAGHILTERAEETGGLLSNVKTAVSSADQALLMANRAMFIGQRIPSLLRLQARLGVQEVLSDSLVHLSELENLTAQATPMVRDLSAITLQIDELAKRAGPLMADFRNYFPRDPNSTMTKKLALGESITNNLLKITTDLNKAHPERLFSLTWTAALAFAAVGAAWATFWWTGYYLVKKRPVLQRENESRKNAA